MIRFLRDVKGGATSITAAMLAVMAVGGTALISDHVWLVDQRDVLKSAADAAAAAATLEINRLPDDLSDRRLNQELLPLAERYVRLNLAHLPEDRYERAVETLIVNVFPDRHQGMVGVTAEADLGGALFASHLPLLVGYTDPEAIKVKAGVERGKEPVDLVLAIDISRSMTRNLQGGRAGHGNPSRLEIVQRAALQIVDIFDGSAHIGVVPWSELVYATTAQWPQYPSKWVYHRSTNPRNAPLLPLTDNPQAVRDAINGLEAVGGGTLSALGIVGGERHLRRGTGDIQAIVLLTDGQDNVCPQWQSCSASELATVRADECTRAKEAGIRIFVVTAMVPGLVTGDLADQLRACSSEADDPEGTYTFLNNSDPESLDAAFLDIAGQLQPMRKIY